MLNIIPYVLITIGSVGHMQKPKQDTIPKTVLKYTTVNVDPGFFESGRKILALDPKYAVIGKGDKPYILYATPKFTANTLPPAIARQIYNVKNIVLQSTFDSDPASKKEQEHIPDWVVNFTQVSSLTFDYFVLDRLGSLKALPLKHLIIRDCKFSDRRQLIEAINQFKELKYFVFDQSLPSGVADDVRRQNPKLIILTQEEYLAKGLADL
ncbi:MAG: hypothetical protein ABIN95_09945 [Mucilaginibacter sp.]